MAEKKIKKEDVAYIGAEGLDMFDPAAGMSLHLPNNSERPFIAKAKAFDVPSRLGKGCCEVLIKFCMPNGDYNQVGDTFDPSVERMSKGRFESLVARKYCTKAPDNVTAKLGKTDNEKSKAKAKG